MPALWRLLEDAIIDKMSNQIGEYVNRQERYQFGFIKGNTTTEAIERAERNWNEPEIRVILIDVKKAYDTVRTDA